MLVQPAHNYILSGYMKPHLHFHCLSRFLEAFFPTGIKAKSENKAFIFKLVGVFLADVFSGGLDVRLALSEKVST